MTNLQNGGGGSDVKFCIKVGHNRMECVAAATMKLQSSSGTAACRDVAIQVTGSDAMGHTRDSNNEMYQRVHALSVIKFNEALVCSSLCLWRHSLPRASTVSMLVTPPFGRAVYLRVSYSKRLLLHCLCLLHEWHETNALSRGPVLYHIN
jgi:hypothetical protein